MPCAAEVSVPPRAKRCKHCEETGQDVEDGAPLWKIQLDQDLLDTIVAVYPDWFKDYKADQGQTMAEGGSTGGSAPRSPPQGEEAPQPCGGATPPKAEVDDSPLQPCIDRNKESLKVKLSLRRPITQLVAQGIYPPLKTPPAFHEQRQKLERAKMGDLLKAKIQQRPDRQELVRQHILEADTDHVAPSLAENTRKLKKCKLADSLNDHLSHRPGVLELIQRNIMHADEPIERAVKEGHIPFKATCEGQVTRPQHPHRYITMDEDSQSSGESAAMSPAGAGGAGGAGGTTVLLPRRYSGGSDVLETAAANAGIVTLALSIPTTANTVVVSSPVLHQQRQGTNNNLALQMYGDLCGNVTYPAPSPVSVGSSASSLSPLSSVASPPAASTCSAPSPITPRPSSVTVVASQPSPAPAVAVAPAVSAAPLTVPLAQTHAALRTDAPGKDKNRKKSKSKTQPKTRTIKFHEYKGPPNAHKNNSLSSSPVETTYELLLQQQQLFLQVQRELQHMYPIILPAAQKPGNSVSSDTQSIAGHTSTLSANTGTLSGIITSTPTPTGTPVATSGTVIGAVDSGSNTLVLTTQASQAAQAALAIPAVPSQSQPAPAAPVEPMQISVSVSAAIQTVPSGSKVPVLGKLEDMKVSDLKAELKKRSLPVSGAKPQLIERLRNFTEISAASSKSCELGPLSNSSISSISGDESAMGMPMDTPCIPSPQGLREFSPPPSTLVMSPVSPASSPGDSQHDMDVGEATIVSPSPIPVTPMSTPIHPSSVPPPSPAPSCTPTPPPSVVQVHPAPSPAPSVPVPSPVMTEDIIREQQRKIEQLQKELLASKQQLQFFWSNKDTTGTSTTPAPSVKPAASNSGLNGFVQSGTQLDPGKTKKLLLQQHLHNKLQTLQRQHQQQQQLQQLQLQQEQQQQQHVAFQQQQQGLNAKASLAAFLHHQAAILPTVNNNNDNISNNNMINNKKQSKCGNQHVATTAVVLNRLNLQKQKGLAGIVNATSTNQHHRTNSLPNLIGSLVQLSAATTDNKPTPTHQHQQRSSSVTPMTTSDNPCQQRTLVLTRNPTQPHFLTLTAVSPPPVRDSSPVTHLGTILHEQKPDKPPPQYEEVANLLKPKQEAVSKTPSGRRSVKSQIVDDVLEILIKNGELPPSAAHDPTTPTTPSSSVTPQPALFNTSAPNSHLFNTESMFSNGAVFGDASDPSVIFNDDIAFKSEGQLVSSPSASTTSTAPSVPPPPPPPPPPLPHTSFSVTLPTALSNTSGMNQVSDSSSFGLFSGNHTLDYILGSVNQAATTVDLKELGLDLETLDSMDFGSLDSAVKLEPTDVDMDAMNQNERISVLHPPPIDDSSDNSHLAEQLLAVSSELMDIGEMPMDMDDSDWLESLIPSDETRAETPEQLPVHNPTPCDPCPQIPVPSSTNYIHYNGHSELDSCDPLLSNSQSPFDLLFEDTEFKMTGDLGATLTWDKVDFAT